MGLSRRQLGEAGERAARRYLLSQGLAILECNYRCSLGEIDIVAREGGVLVFVEVRTRRGRRFGEAVESITPAKAARLRKLALYYLQHRVGRELPCRFDVVAIRMDSSGEKVAELVHHRGVETG